jgi:hypothetical protein
MGWAPNYLDVEDLAEYERIDDAVDNIQLGWAIAAASRAVDRTASPEGMRQFGLVDSPEVRFYTATWSCDRCMWTVEIDDVMTTAGFALAFDSAKDGTYASPITAYRLLPANAVAKGKPWTHVEVLAGSTVQPDRTPDAVQGIAQWGWTSVPDAVVQATALQASRLFARRQSPFGVAGSPEQGSEIRLLAKVDPDVAVALKDFMRRKLVLG